MEVVDFSDDSSSREDEEPHFKRIELLSLRDVCEPSSQCPHPGPLHICVVDTKEQPRVVFWQFNRADAPNPSVIRKNTLAAISDGTSVAKITLFEKYSSKINMGESYVMMGYSLRGNQPPYSILITQNTKFFNSAPVEVNEQLRNEAENLLNPMSTLTPLCRAKEMTGLVTVEAQVVELFNVKKRKVGKEDVPLKTVTLQQDKIQVTVNLWREAALFSLEIGDLARITHLNGKMSAKYGFCLQSTNYTKMEFLDMPAASCLQSEYQFRCSICLDVFTDPVTTTCGHNFCKNCITEHWYINVPYQCPMCKEIFSTRPELKINTLISEMVAEFRQSAHQRTSSSIISEHQVAKPGEVQCDICSGTKLKAVKSCLVCLVSYCETHLEPHLSLSVLQKHQMIDPVDSMEGRICLKHSRPLELFCETDQTCVCMLCSVLDHKTHEIVLKE